MSQMLIEEPADRLAAPPKMTYEEFLDWADEDTHAEWVDGEVVLMSPVSDAHQEVSSFSLRMIVEFVEAHQLGKVRYESFQMKLATNPRGWEPDILFVARENLSRLKANYLDGPADLVVEVVSPDSIERDRVTKFAEYQQGGVREYWLIDPVTQAASFFVLADQGRYQAMLPDADRCYQSTVLRGLWLRTDWLWQSPMPLLSEIRKELGLP